MELSEKEEDLKSSEYEKQELYEINRQLVESNEKLSVALEERVSEM